LCGIHPSGDNVLDHLGLDNKFSIGDLALQMSLQNQSRLADNSHVPTLLCIEFLDYIMSHQQTFERPEQFTSLLKLHGHDYQGYINTLSQKHQKHRDPTPTARQTFEQYFSELEQVINKLQQMQQLQQRKIFSKQLTSSLFESRRVLDELRARIPVAGAQNNLASVDDTQLLRLADVCSHLKNGLEFISQNQARYQASVFSYTTFIGNGAFS
jgi:flagellar biosynthesis chaperone FliJ